MTTPPLSIARMQARAGQLIVAHESERDRIAGELHDDVAQQIAGLSMEIGILRRRVTNDPALAASLLTLLQQAMGLADTVSRISRTLHPGLVQYGLVAALERLCREVQDQHGVAVTLDAPQDFPPFTAQTARCFFRGAEEALRNVVTHANARSAHVVLSNGDGRWTLAITDDGRGFDVAGIRPSGDGLGLFVVEERARLAGGCVQIESAAGRGTAVTLVIPAVTST